MAQDNDNRQPFEKGFEQGLGAGVAGLIISGAVWVIKQLIKGQKPAS